MEKRVFFVCMMIVVLFFGIPNDVIACEKKMADTGKLFELVNKRLSYMKDVAAFKWVNKKPIEDISREAVVIQKASEAAGKEGLDVESTQLFFGVQIEAAKQIQRGWHKVWRENGFPEDVTFADLKTEIRPALIKLGNEIIIQIKTAGPTLRDPDFSDKLKSMIKSGINIKYVDDKTKEKLLKALSKIELAK